MTNTLGSVLVMANMHKQESAALVEEIQQRLTAEGISVHVRRFYGDADIGEIPAADLVISLGGDGTVLYCARLVAAKGIPILPVNLGSFGFITEVAASEWYDALVAYRAGEVVVGSRLMLQAELYRDGRLVCTNTGLNDVVITKAGISNLISVKVRVSGGVLGRYRADGVLIATPTGSTAYSAAAGGPILHPEMQAIIVNPVCPFTLSYRPVVLPPEETVTVEVDEPQRAQLMLTVDGQTMVAMQEGDVVQIRRAPHEIGILRSTQRSFYDVLRSKLNWSGGPDD